MKKNKPPFPTLSSDCFVIDSHCHLDMDSYQKDLDILLQNARRHGIRSIISIGIDEKSSAAAIALAHRYPFIKATVGIHPHDAQQVTSNTYPLLTELVHDNRDQVVGYGEIGLDYVKDYSPKSVQIKIFEEQLELAQRLNLPVIIHDREAHDDCLAILKNGGPYPNGGVMHCFSGDIAFAEQVLELGFYISIPGVVTFKNGIDLQEVVTAIPLESLLIETDGPFLAPVPYRGKRNDPVYLLYTAEKIAQLKNCSIDDVARQTSTNCLSLFRYSVEEN